MINLNGLSDHEWKDADEAIKDPSYSFLNRFRPFFQSTLILSLRHSSLRHSSLRRSSLRRCSQNDVRMFR
jgi:hypothetical protein